MVNDMHAQRNLIFIPTCRRICMVVVKRAERPQGSSELYPSIEQYLDVLHTKRRAPATLKVVRQDLIHFVARWEHTRRRTFDPVLLWHEDLCDWWLARQRDNWAAPATNNHGLVSLRGYCLSFKHSTSCFTRRSKLEGNSHITYLDMLYEPFQRWAPCSDL